MYKLIIAVAIAIDFLGFNANTTSYSRIDTLSSQEIYTITQQTGYRSTVPFGDVGQVGRVRFGW